MEKNISVLFLLTLFILPANGDVIINRKVENIEVVFVLDTTGSMAGLIDGAKKKIWSIANTIVDVNPEANIRMGLVAYRDRDDGYVIKSNDLSTDMQGLYGNLIKLEADGGGDTQESVNEALDEAVRNFDWTKGSDTKRIIFLVGDAPPHMDYKNAPLYPDVLKRAKADGIIVNTVQAGDDRETKKIWQEIAQLGHGRYMAIPQDGGKIVVIETPYDNDIIIIRKQIDKTVIPYGGRAEQAKVEQKMETMAQAPAPVQLDSSRYLSKKISEGSREVVTGGGDLVADVNNGIQKLDAVKDDELPENLRGKSITEKQAMLDQVSQERKELEQKMEGLIDKRDAYIAEQSNTPRKGGDSFDAAVESTLREQLK